MLHRRIGPLLSALAAVLAALPAPVCAEFSVPGFELVHNAPAETTLATPDLREPVAVWTEMIARARHDIAIEQFYVTGEPGEALDPVMEALEAAGRRGVRIRFLMEKKGEAMSDPATIDRLKRIPNLEFRTLAWGDVAGAGIIHAKVFVIDGREGYVGSQNFDWRALSQIDETGLRITDRSIARRLQAIFEQDWRAQARIAAGETAPPVRAETYVPPRRRAMLVASPNAYNPPGVGDSQSALVSLIGAAEREIVAEVMQYSTTAFGGGDYRVIDDALRAAAARGVKVRLLIADWALTERRLPGLLALSAAPGVEIRVATIPQLSSGEIPYARVVHTKVMTIDDAIAWVGTSNWEGGYLDTSRNVEVVLRDAVMAKRLRALQEQLWTSAYAASLEEACSRLAVPAGD
ncbi:phospholipase [Novosphingobium sp. PC22D]|uniref:phospholipase D-like domain-containing protein n=1 Tax=Novosphingobium sp. PC22D TaxID=1962403 RepID=UPI000BEFE615|nr:phospholipase D-like domain-containing protein [Novosphingobium sp. PC22D]PEQ13426.1 phospholipase [Novosphingobium sp. PC22D]